MILTTSYKSCKHILEIGKEIQRQQLGPFDILRSGNSSFSWKTSIETNVSGGAESIVSPCAPADWTVIGTGDPIATLVQLQKLCKINSVLHNGVKRQAVVHVFSTVGRPDGMCIFVDIDYMLSLTYTSACNNTEETEFFQRLISKALSTKKIDPTLCIARRLTLL